MAVSRPMALIMLVAVLGALSLPAVAVARDSVTADGLERALLARGGPPRPTTASCRRATAQQRRAAPFRSRARPVFRCVLTVGGERAGYDVQVLGDGCFVAERLRRGRAVYGCGARG